RVLQRGDVEGAGSTDVLDDGALPELVGGRGHDVDYDAGGLGELGDHPAVAAGRGVERRVDQQRDLVLGSADGGGREARGGQQRQGGSSQHGYVQGHLLPFVRRPGIGPGGKRLTARFSWFRQRHLLGP